ARIFVAFRAPESFTFLLLRESNRVCLCVALWPLSRHDMATFKRILILANSIKLGGRCLAGREILLNGESEYRIGPWLRPVSHVDGREIKYMERFYWPQDPVKVGDFAEVALGEKMNEPWHPENWRLASYDSWRRIADTFVFPPLDLLE